MDESLGPYLAFRTKYNHLYLISSRTRVKLSTSCLRKKQGIVDRYIVVRNKRKKIRCVGIIDDESFWNWTFTISIRVRIIEGWKCRLCTEIFVLAPSQIAFISLFFPCCYKVAQFLPRRLIFRDNVTCVYAFRNLSLRSRGLTFALRLFFSLSLSLSLVARKKTVFR